MLTKNEMLRINKKLIELGMTKRDLSREIGYPLSYSRVVGVINRKIESKPIEWQLRKWVQDNGR